MKGKTNWVHFSFGGSVPMLDRNDEGHTTFCGKTARRIAATNIMDNVTCPLCLHELKKHHWYCPRHKFIHDNNVTYEENCALCGLPVGLEAE